MATETLVPNGEDSGWPTGAPTDIDEGIPGDAVAVMSTTVDDDIMILDLSASVVADADTVTSVTVRMDARSTGAGGKDSIGVFLLVGGTRVGGEQITTVLTGSFATYTLNVAAWDADKTAAEMDGMQLEVRANQTGKAEAATWEIDAIDVDIVYTPQVFVDLDSSISQSLSIAGDIFNLSNTVVLRQVERVPVSFLASDNVKTATLVTTLLDITKAFVFATVRGVGSDQENVCVQVEITNTTTITMTRFDAAAGDGACEVIAYVCEFTEGVLVERGVTEITAASVDVNLDTIDDITNSFISLSLRAPGTAWGTDEATLAQLVSGTPNKIHFEIDSAGGTNVFVAWEVIQYVECSVQRSSAPTIAGGSLSTTAAISSVDLAKSILLFSYRTNGGTESGGQHMLRGRFTSATELTFDRGASGASVPEISYEVVSFTDDTDVQTVSEDFIATDGQEDATISAVSSLAKAMAISSAWGGRGRQDYTVANLIGESSWTLDLTSTTNLQSKRDETNDAAAGEFYVVDFGAVVSGFVDIDSAISQSLTVNSAPNLLTPIDSSISQSLSIAARQNVIRPLDALLSSSVSISAILGANFQLDSQVNLSLAVTGEISKLAGLFSQIDMSLAVSGEIDKLIGLYSDLAMSLSVLGLLNAPINLDGLISQALTIGAEASRLRSLDALSASALTLAARLNVIRPLSSSIDTTLSLAGELGPIRGLNSDISSSLDIQAELGPLRGLAATVPTVLSLDAALGATFDFDALVSQSLAVNGNFSRLRLISTSIGLSLVIGSELDVVPAGSVFVDLDGSLSQSLVLGSSLNIIRPIYASIDQSLTVNADVNLLKNLVSQIVFGLTVAGELSTASSIDLASQIALALSISALADNQTGFSSNIQSSLLTNADLNVLRSFSANFNFQSSVNARLGAVFDISGSIDSSLVFDGTLSCFIGLSGDVQCSLIMSGSRENLAGLFGSVDFILTSQADASCIVGMWGSIDQAMSLIGELEGVSDIVYEIGRSSVRIIQRGGNSNSRTSKGGGITSGTE